MLTALWQINGRMADKPHAMSLCTNCKQGGKLREQFVVRTVPD